MYQVVKSIGTEKNGGLGVGENGKLEFNGVSVGKKTKSSGVRWGQWLHNNMNVFNTREQYT